MGVSCNTVSES